MTVAGFSGSAPPPRRRVRRRDSGLTPKFRKSGLIGFEIEGTGKIFMRNIWLKKL